MEQKNEALYLINGDRFLHLRENGAGVGFATYDCATGEPLESRADFETESAARWTERHSCRPELVSV